MVLKEERERMEMLRVVQNEVDWGENAQCAHHPPQPTGEGKAGVIVGNHRGVAVYTVPRQRGGKILRPRQRVPPTATRDRAGQVAVQVQVAGARYMP